MARSQHTPPSDSLDAERKRWELLDARLERIGLECALRFLDPFACEEVDWEENCRAARRFVFDHHDFFLSADPGRAVDWPDLGVVEPHVVEAMAVVWLAFRPLEDLENNLTCALAGDAQNAFDGVVSWGPEGGARAELEMAQRRVAALQWARLHLRQHVAMTRAARAQRGQRRARFNEVESARLNRRLVRDARAANRRNELNPPPDFGWNE